MVALGRLQGFQSLSNGSNYFPGDVLCFLRLCNTCLMVPFVSSYAFRFGIVFNDKIPHGFLVQFPAGVLDIVVTTLEDGAF